MSIIRPGVIALLSILAIAAIFVFAHYDRQAKAYDEAAHRAALRINYMLAQQAKAARAKVVQDAPQAEGDLRENLQAARQAQAAAAPVAIDMEAIKNADLKIAPEVQLEAIPGPEGAPESVAVWHPKGIMRYIVSAKGVKTEYQ